MSVSAAAAASTAARVLSRVFGPASLVSERVDGGDAGLDTRPAGVLVVGGLGGGVDPDDADRGRRQQLEPSVRRRQPALQRRVQEGLGFAVAGTITERYTVCGKASCRCHADPPRRHGPYYQYSRKVAGKTISRLVTAEQADQYRQWIANRRMLDEITEDIDKLSHQAIELLTRPDN